MRFMIDTYHDKLRVLSGIFPSGTRAALNVSIQKWRFLSKTPLLTRCTNDGGTDTCALCNVYYHLNCKGCQVAEVNGGFGLCLKTPYQAFVSAETSTTKRRAAEKELHFLEEVGRKWKQKRHSEAKKLMADLASTQENQPVRYV